LCFSISLNLLFLKDFFIGDSKIYIFDVIGLSSLLFSFNLSNPLLIIYNSFEESYDIDSVVVLVSAPWWIDDTFLSSFESDCLSSSSFLSSSTYLYSTTLSVTYYNGLMIWSDNRARFLLKNLAECYYSVEYHYDVRVGYGWGCWDS
jgi:hypothetical protein